MAAYKAPWPRCLSVTSGHRRQYVCLAAIQLAVEGPNRCSEALQGTIKTRTGVAGIAENRAS